MYNVMSREELVLTTGGSFSATMFGHILRAVGTVIDFGRQIGSTLRRITSGKFCSL